MFSISLQLLIPFCFYIIAMISIGLLFYRKTKTQSDYLLGSRGLNSWVTSLSAQASDMSGWLLLGLPGYAYVAGLEAGWIALGLAIGTYLNWKFVASRLRLLTEKTGNAITLPDYFEKRFLSESTKLRILSAVFILIFFLIYTASGFVAGAKLFSTVFGFSYLTALSIGVFVIISYTFLGGFLAVCWTDFFQGLIMFFAVLIVPLLIIVTSGGLGETFHRIRQINPNLLNMFNSISGSALPLSKIISLMAWGLGYFGQPHILARFMAIKRPREIPKARIIAMIWVILSLTAAVLVGVTAHACIQTPLEEGSSETVFMVMVNQLVFPLLAGFLLAAILAAIMSTADSQLLVASSALTEDLYQSIFRRQVADKQRVWISRFAVIGIAIFAYVFALNPESSVLDLVAYAWAGFGATFGPIIILSLFWHRMTSRGAMAGMLVGGITVLVWKQLTGGIFELYEILPGFLLSSIAILLFSLTDSPPSQQVKDQLGIFIHKLEDKYV